MARMRSAPGRARASSGWWRTSTEHSYLKTAALFGTGRSEERPKADAREVEAEVRSGSNATLGIRSSLMRRPSGCSAPYPHLRGLRHGKHLESSAATALIIELATYSSARQSVLDVARQAGSLRVGFARLSLSRPCVPGQVDRPGDQLIVTLAPFVSWPPNEATWSGVLSAPPAREARRQPRCPEPAPTSTNGERTVQRSGDDTEHRPVTSSTFRVNAELRRRLCSRQARGLFLRPFGACCRLREMEATHER